ncbi:hypothetical protein CLU97_3268 [Chryseobacterium sp. 7]|uniref:hypothetical protein n=1 Tax=Chryseobacterium sp. 7 TaxID=2035214 RepID=UPI000EB5B71C|nr:hypothetical protein [Chryseobacterium sp. 7]RLJ33781.1 hypothetical protein CLU97_3268 [Chryseobacterium sp. 7]
MKSTESINNLFRLSRFLEVYEDGVDHVYLHSAISHKRILISRENYKLLLTGSFSPIDAKIVKELIDKAILVPDIIDEKEFIANHLQGLNKLTLVFDDVHFSTDIFQNIFQSLKKVSYHDICLLFALQNKKNLAFIKEGLRKYSKEFENIAILRLEKEKINSFSNKINIYKSVRGFDEEKRIYSHRMIYNVNESEINEPLSSGEKISFKEINPAIMSIYGHQLTGPKTMNGLSVLLTAHHDIKELPISGFIVDYHRLSDFIRNEKINKNCINCSVLPTCGGYFEEAAVECPSFKNIQLKNFGKEKEEESSNHLAGVSNNLILKSDFLKHVDDMIVLNVPDCSEYMAIFYLNNQYYRGFSHAKAGKLIEAGDIFAYADKISTQLLPQSGFSYNFIQTFITSNKSYLSFKLNNNEEALNITKDGIRYSIELDTYRSIEILSLHISQMLMNMSTVYLAVNDMEKWRETTMANINYLLNFELPIHADGYDISLLKKAPAHLRYFMLLEIINQILTRIIKKGFEPGLQLLREIKVKDLSTEIDRQISEWVSLIIISCSPDTSITDFEIRLSEFYSSENEIIELSKLKLFLRFMIKSNNKKIHKNIL